MKDIEEDKVLLFTIGQVAKMYDISHDTLRYYDKVGVLKPSIKKENGYRYYTIREIELLEIILIAKKLEIPIKDIKEIIEKEDINSYIELFENHEKILDKKIKYLTELKTQVKNSKDIANRMREFSNEKLGDGLSYKHINKKVIFFNQSGDSYIGTVVKDKNLIMILNKNTENKIVLNDSLIGVEVFENEILDFYNYTEYVEKEFIGEYIVTTRKDTYTNLENFINETLNKLYDEESLEKDFTILLEVMFTISRKNKDNLYFANLYIPKF